MSTLFHQVYSNDECSVSSWDSVEMYWELYQVIFSFYNSSARTSYHIILSLLAGKFGICIHSAVPFKLYGTFPISIAGVSGQYWSILETSLMTSSSVLKVGAIRISSITYSSLLNCLTRSLEIIPQSF